MKILRITDYSYVIASYEIVQDWKKHHDNDLIITIMDTYIYATKINTINNSDKLKLLIRSQTSMTLSIIIIGITIIFLAIGYIH